MHHCLRKYIIKAAVWLTKWYAVCVKITLRLFHICTNSVWKLLLVMDEQDSEKRTVKMTEKAVEENKYRQLQARRYKLSQLTSMVKHIEQLMEDDANAVWTSVVCRKNFPI